MILIIDAYNILKTMYGTHTLSNRQSAHFTTQMLERAASRGYQAYIVFDGCGANNGRTERSPGGAVLYSGAAATADDVIYQLAEEFAGNEVVVVSADRRLRSKSSKVGAKLLEPQVLWRVLFPEPTQSMHASQAQRATRPVTPAHHAEDDLAALLARAPCDVADKEDEDDMPELRTRSGYTEPKRVKRMKRIVERL